MTHNPIIASAVMYSMDNRGTLWLQIFDATGSLVCVCPVHAEAALDLSDFIDDHIPLEDDDSIGQVEGHA